MSEKSVHDIPPLDRRLMLQNMLNSPAFVLFLDKWQADVLGAIENEIFDLKTDAARTHLLKEVRAAISDTHNPRKVVETLIRTSNSESQKPRN